MCVTYIDADRIRPPVALSQRRAEEAGVLFDTLNPQPKRAKRRGRSFSYFPPRATLCKGSIRKNKR
jgi:hypothetical protein